MSEPIYRTAGGDGVAIRLAVWEGGGTPLLCIHGLTANCRCWDAVAGAAAGRSRVIAVDLRGRGYSESPAGGYSIAHHCRDIICIMDDMKLEKAVFAGHSLGASIALSLAAEHPERAQRLILVDGGGVLSKEEMRKVFAGIQPSLERLGKIFPSADAYLDRMRQAPFLQPWSSHLETYFRYELEEARGGVRCRIDPACIAEEAANLKGFDASRFYGRVRCPVLILRAAAGMMAEDDLLLPDAAVKRMLREMRDARCVTVEGANHYSIVFGASKRRDRAILEFLPD